MDFSRQVFEAEFEKQFERSKCWSQIFEIEGLSLD